MFKSVENAKKAFDLGFPMKALQVGGLGNGTNKVMISNELSLSEQEAEMLEAMQNEGVAVTLQVTPKDPPSHPRRFEGSTGSNADMR